MANNELSRVESFQYPAGHIGHLSGNQAIALDGFKRLCEKEGYYKPADANGRGQASHDDETLLRYLRARKFNQREAFKQFKDTEDWRRDNELDKLYETIDVAEYEETRRLYPQWTGRRDKRGIPVYVYEVAGLDVKTISAHEQSGSHTKVKSRESPKMLRLFALYENLTRFVMPLCSAIPGRPHPKTPISQSNNIVDISGVGLKQFWNLKAHMQDASQLATAHYPETLDRIFIIGAPSFFPTVWGWIKRWFDPITVSKIFILSNQSMKSTLEQYIDIDNIPKKYGGNLDFRWGDMPLLEPAIEDALEWENVSMQRAKKTIPTGPIKWQESNGNTVILAVGSANGTQRNETVARLKSAREPQRTSQLSTDTVSYRQVAHARLGAPSLFRTTTGNYTHPMAVDADAQDVHIRDDVPEQSLAQIPFDDQGRIQNPSPSPGRSQDYPRQSQDFKSQSKDYRSTSRDFSFPALNPPTAAESRVDTTPAGTFFTRFSEHSYTQPSAELSSSTPSIAYHGYGERTQTIESRTVGQAPKDVSVPAYEPPSDDSYIAQAKNLAGSAYETGVSAVSTAMGAIGLSGTDADKEAGGEAGSEDHQVPGKDRTKDPRVQNVSDQDVEEFLRSQYASASRAGDKK